MSTPTQFPCPRRTAAARRQHFLQARRLESVATLAGGLAHDLNNVLAPIITFAELLRCKVAGADEQKCLELLVGNAWKGAEIVRQVLTFADGVEGDRVDLHLEDLIGDTCRELQPTLPAEIMLMAGWSPGLWPVAGDAAQLRQVLVNIVRNSREAISGRGRISIRAVNTRVDSAAARSHPGITAGPYALIIVSDDGCGIPVAHFERIFDPFFSTKTAHGLGRGLGLSIAHGIVKSHGGFLQLESDVGLGTEFQIYLPAQPKKRQTR